MADQPTRAVIDDTLGLGGAQGRRIGGPEFELNGTRLLDRVRLKYSGGDRRLWDLLLRHLVIHRRYYDHHLPLWHRTSLTGADFAMDQRLMGEREEIHEVRQDAVRFVAALSGVDGSIVLTDRCPLLGFGGEVIATSPALLGVRLADTAEGHGTRILPIESFGTRHRAAFRFASGLDDCVVFIMSQDGGVKAVKRVGAEVVMWPDTQTSAFGTL